MGSLYGRTMLPACISPMKREKGKKEKERLRKKKGVKEKKKEI